MKTSVIILSMVLCLGVSAGSAQQGKSDRTSEVRERRIAFSNGGLLQLADNGWTLRRAQEATRRTLMEIMMALRRGLQTDHLNRSIDACGVVLVAALGIFANAPAAFAQDKVKAGMEIWKKVGCAECHGSFADGEKQRDESLTGANLRTTRHSAAELKVVISCGKPGGAGMPSFDEGAYKVRACYGQPFGAPPSNLYPTGVTLTPDEIDLVIAYRQARVIGKGRITKQECLAYYEDRPDECEDIN